MSADLTPEDLRAACAPKSDQLNADDLVAGPMTVQVRGIRKGGAEQPVEVFFAGVDRPWRPCKTERRVLAYAWGSDPKAWIGRWMVLYRDPNVAFGGDKVGGIRLQAMSDIKAPVDVALTATRGKKARRHVEVFTPRAAPPPVPEWATSGDDLLDDDQRAAAVRMVEACGWKVSAVESKLGAVSTWTRATVRTIAERAQGGGGK